MWVVWEFEGWTEEIFSREDDGFSLSCLVQTVVI